MIIEVRVLKHLRRVNQLAWLEWMRVLFEDLRLSCIIYLKFLKTFRLIHHLKHLILCLLKIGLELLHTKA